MTDDEKKTPQEKGLEGLKDSEMVDKEKEKIRIKATPLYLLTIDEVITHRLSDPTFFGDDSERRMYPLEYRTDVRVKRMATAIQLQHRDNHILYGTVIYASIQHGREIGYVKYVKQIDEINSLYQQITGTENSEKKDARDDGRQQYPRPKYRGFKTLNCGFKQVDQEDIRDEALRFGVAVSFYNTVCLSLSCQTSEHISKDCLEACEHYQTKYLRYMDDRIRDLNEIADGII